MKVFFLSFVYSLLFVQLSAQTVMSYTLQGTVSGNIEKLYVTTDYRVLDTIFVQDGKFYYEGKTDKFVNYLSTKDGRLNQKFFVRQGEQISLSYEKGDYLALMNGSELNERYTGMYRSIADLKKEYDVVLGNSRKEIFACKDSSKKEELVLFYREKLHAIQYRQADVAREFVQTHLSDELSLVLLWEFFLHDWENLIPLFDQLHESAKQNPLLAEVESVVNQKRVAQLGGKVMSESFKDANGEELRFSNWNGKYVLVDFWASWCGPCISELVYFKKIWEKLKDTNFEIVLISLDFNEQNWRKCFAEHALPEWIQVMDSDKRLRKAFGVTGVPASFLIDPSGVIIGRGFKFESIVEDVIQTIQKDKSK